MKLHEIVSARYGCKIPAKYNKPAIEYYINHSQSTKSGFIFNLMNDLNELHSLQR